jgi:hypothetical protein
MSVVWDSEAYMVLIWKPLLSGRLVMAGAEVPMTPMTRDSFSE